MRSFPSEDTSLGIVGKGFARICRAFPVRDDEILGRGHTKRHAAEIHEPGSFERSISNGNRQRDLERRTTGRMPQEQDLPLPREFDGLGNPRFDAMPHKRPNEGREVCALACDGCVDVDVWRGMPLAMTAIRPMIIDGRPDSASAWFRSANAGRSPASGVMIAVDTIAAGDRTGRVRRHPRRPTPDRRRAATHAADVGNTSESRAYPSA